MTDQGDIDDLVREFINETSENLDEADNYMVALESDPENQDLLSRIFRTVHTVKGTSGFLGYANLGSLAHNAENLLCLLRDGEIQLTEEITNALLATFDCIREFVAHIERDGVEGDASYDDLIATLSRLSGASDPGDDPEHTAISDARTPEAARADVVSSFLRIDVSLVDRLMSLVGELVLTRNQMARFTRGNNPELLNTVQRLSQVTSELQESVLKTRMQPISTAWGKVPRMVRDLANSFGKKVLVQFEGSDTELDKAVIEAFKDPLLHMVRNTVDHGIESPAERTAAGKPEEGMLVLRAFHEGGQINIEISDDGRGLDLARLRDRAVARDLITMDRAEEMTSKELANLIFLPGLSTAPEVSKISGRGVGMDVVKTNIESIGGTIEVQSAPGVGTRIRIKIPLTLAIVPALIIHCGGQRFALPQVHLRELVCFEGHDMSCNLDMVHGAPIYRLRGRLLPLVLLRKELELTNATVDLPSIRRGDFGFHLAILDAGGCSFGLVADSIASPEEIVVKPLPRQIKGIEVFAGAAVMGDGNVALIVDVQGLAQRARVVSALEQHAPDARQESAPAAEGELQSYLIIDVGDERRAAIPMRVVDRLEVFRRSAVETTVRGPVVQYRDSIMPLIPLPELMGVDLGVQRNADSLPVIVCAREGTPTGVVVPGIVDIVKGDIVQWDKPMDSTGVVGSTVIDDRVTDLLDFEMLLDRVGSVPTPINSGHATYNAEQEEGEK